MKEANLFFKDGGSDKEYHAKIEKKGTGYVVNFAYGRRGSALATGTKTQKPVSIEEAEKVFDKLVKEKTAKGYTPSEDGKAFAMSADAGRVSGLLPQLLNPISEEEAERLIEDDAYGAQGKLDGKRIMIRKKGNVVEGSNRKGLIVSLPQEIVDELLGWDKLDLELDGELIGSTYYTFDILSMNDVDLREGGYFDRYKELPGGWTTIRRVDLATTTKEKRALLKKLQAAGKEGIVFKKLNAAYHPGRPNAGGNQLKFKFYATCSAVVSGLNQQRSVSLEIQGVPVGNVTITPNKEVPKLGDVVEVRYLYAYKGGSLYQPQFLMVRDDLVARDCRLTQLKYKNEEEEL